MKSTPTIVRSTIWNFLGLGLPVAAAIGCIPPVIRGLGVDRFGVLALGWMLMGFFALLDLGIGQATTKYIAEYLERNDHSKLPTLISNSLTAHCLFGLVGACVLASTAPLLCKDVFRIPADLTTEAVETFYLLAISIPLIVVAGCLRGILEATRRFDLVNLVKIPASLANYIIPLVMLSFTTNLAYVVAVIVASRMLVLAAFWKLTRNVLPDVSPNFQFDIAVVKRLLSFGGWVTVSNLMAPSVALIDRVLIVVLVSAAAVTYYVTPYEVVTKLWMFSASMLSVLFPVFSALSVTQSERLGVLGRRAIHYLLIILTPLVAILLTFSRELLGVWIGTDFATASAPIAKWLSLGVFINVLAQVPYTMLQSTGHGRVVAKVHMAELLIYVPLAWYLIRQFGALGAAIAWATRAFLDAILMLMAARIQLPRVKLVPTLKRAVLRLGAIAGFLFFLWEIDSSARFVGLSKAIVFLVAAATFVFWEARVMLTSADRTEFVTWLTRIAANRH
jgi:O-antigen/teichoic acid export membrane protein